MDQVHELIHRDAGEDAGLTHIRQPDSTRLSRRRCISNWQSHE
jgi:hypothetical protein